ncbi:MAG: hypothetical protein ABL977_03340 [Candidatus Eisenbacteria bacterium]
MSPRTVVATVIAVAGLGMLLQPAAVPFAESLAADVQSLLERPRLQAARRPARTLPLRAGDTARFPRDRFGFVFSSERGTRIDTRSGTMTIDRVMDPDTTIALRFSEAELDTLYKEAIAIRLFDELTLDPEHKDAEAISSSQRYGLSVRTGASEREFGWQSYALADGRWADGSWAAGRAADDWKRLNEFVGHAAGIARRHAEYRALPPARGVYID